tara:strand:- start:343 stop:486 length:144 start_codon:yes stop_codon:yes gene_type:complete
MIEVIVTAVVQVKTNKKAQAVEDVQKHLFRENSTIRKIKQIIVKTVD